MSKIKNGGLDQYGTEPVKQQQFGKTGSEWVKTKSNCNQVTMQQTSNTYKKFGIGA